MRIGRLVVLSGMAVILSAAGQGPVRQQWSDGNGPRVPASGERPAVPGKGSFRVDSELVLVPVTVLDRNDHFITGLSSRDFRLYADHSPTPVLGLSEQEAAVSLVLVLDVSGSMKGLQNTLRESVRQLMESSRPEDEFLVVAAHDTPEQLSEFTRDPSEIEQAVGRMKAAGWTPLYDSIVMGAFAMKKARNPRKVLLVVSDADDNHSRYTGPETARLLREMDLRMYVLALPCNCSFETGPSAEMPLQSMTEETGGRYLMVGSRKDLSRKMGQLNFRNFYVLSFRPGELPPDGKYHRVDVELGATSLPKRSRVYWRRGFFAPEL